MKKEVVLFLIVLAGCMLLISFYNFREEPVSDEPTRIPPRNETVPPGTGSQDIVRTNDETRIPELMQPTALVKTTTTRLLQEACDRGTERCKLHAIYDFVRQNYEHVHSSVQHNYIQAPDQTLLYGTGDDLELALLLASMSSAAGFPSEILVGPYHTFVRVQLGEEQIFFDPSCQACLFMSTSVTLSGNERTYT